MSEDYPLQNITKRILFVQDVIRNDGIVRMPLNINRRKEMAGFLRMLASHLQHTAVLVEEWPNFIEQ